MLATHILSLHPSPPPTNRPSLLSTSRPALADSTNINSYSHVCDPIHRKAFVYPTSSARTSCGWNDIESSIPTSSHSRHHHATPSLFPVTQKAPPTVSISLSAACSQSTLGEYSGGVRAQAWEPDLPDVKSVVPFPSTPLDGDMDVDMLDGTCAPCSDAHSPIAGRAPRKRRSAHSSVSSSQGSLGKEAKQKRPRKSRHHVAELLWLGIVHRSILRGIEARQSAGAPNTSTGLLSGRCEFDAMDRLLVEKIQRRLSENGCTEGQVLPNPLPRISSPSISVPSLNLSDPDTLSTALNPKGSDPVQPISKAPPCISDSAVPPSTSTSLRPHVRFEIPPRPRQSHLSIPRRSPSPQARAGTSPSAQTLTLTMPQLVASLILAYRDRSRPRLRGRSYKVAEQGKNAGRSPSSTPHEAVQRSDGEPIRDKERMRRTFTSRVRIPCAAERKSPLSCVAYVES